MRYAKRIALLLILILLSAVSSSRIDGHCDALDGPVVLAAKAALDEGDGTPVLKWVKPEDEKEIREAFTKAIEVRALGGDARDVADRHFFETLVRVHPAGEGVAYSGLKPAGAIDPGIHSADKALDQGSPDKLAADMGEAVAAGLRTRFSRVVAAKSRADESVEAGREYVAAYAEYVHYAQAVHALASGPAGEQHHIHAAAR
jgi:hypothetical protein